MRLLRCLPRYRRGGRATPAPDVLEFVHDSGRGPADRRRYRFGLGAEAFHDINGRPDFGALAVVIVSVLFVA